MMNQEDLMRYRKQLLDMRNRSRDEINRSVEVVSESANPVGEHDRAVSESIDKEVALGHTEERIHREVLSALQRIDDGTFGPCQRCGAAIPQARLDVLPFATYCVSCERSHELDES